MTANRQGSIHLFRIAGIDLYLDWSWFVVAYYEISRRQGIYASTTWNVLEYLALFLIVLLHEFGHALACRQVGGRADQIVLWPLGGVAYVAPPQRPGATLWSIAAGPLVNVALLPVLRTLGAWGRSQGWEDSLPNAYAFIGTLWYINLGLLIFNLLPIYPLDGGQILRSLLWFVMGRAKSLLVATIVGLLGVLALILVAWQRQSVWIGILCVFIVLNCWNGFRMSLALLRAARLPRHPEFACPSCGASPPIGAFWRCGQCEQPFDTFLTRAVCPHCGAQYPTTRCADCGVSNPMNDWLRTCGSH